MTSPTAPKPCAAALPIDVRGSALPAMGNGPQLSSGSRHFAANSLTSCPHMARPVGLRGGCGVIGVGASRGRMAAVQPGRELWQRTQIDLRARSHGLNDDWPIEPRRGEGDVPSGVGERPLSSEKEDEICSL